ncbi:coiled-coil domain-containing protein 81-like [Strongylocentrotus purpuratus]|uniref:Coiled-coil domain-containing protein 81 n=1 Tax=Strongylocentrotus purpuratus TaxID=7668 RepID=A0A7M7PGM9_STRPU|nr:coiled-coil domain-containing protein 81-like [Strongylocentrotus purpuratus]8SNB_1K Chain 1K, Coiled-coil domain-containing protein 81 [Strongylocentrotus purpuratus]8SNB_1L Chain 1L, Coiled-coil domain-containing protein 81 [Strongylocentrotus purpuratus]8SNB_1M Chain 1M, Coiled-coil domain-containing protein 81 [Strongylocentrotus purpuratus]8SNB_1v Chain 1v, Coiled-coil domain-containing protein 81 [Strongylocentrotus purpuratus]8SNB_1w Chain 1w, Coiled-coil domain-containing protein 81
MTEVLSELVSDAKRHKFSTIPKLSDDDIVSVWENVANFVERHMALQKGVQIHGLGTFTFTQKKIDIGNNKFILIQRPVFVLSEKFAQTHRLSYTKHFTSGQVPIVQLNFAVLSNESPFDRDSVEGCVREVLQALSRAVQSKRNVEFSFTGIGRLTIRDSKVKMKFYKDFLTMMDGSGHLVEALKNRPDTADSVLSRASVFRPSTSGTLVLPRITQGAGKDGFSFENGEAERQMPAIEEAREYEEQEEARLEYAPNQEDEGLGKEIEEEARKKPATPMRPSSRQVIPTAKATSIGFLDDLAPSPRPQSRGLKGTPSPPPGKPPSPKGELPPPRLAAEIRESLANEAEAMERAESASCSHAHEKAGQELCYLCHQRAVRNVPVSFESERRRKEQEQDRLLQQFQHLKDTESILRDQAQNMSNKHHSQKIAAFNLGVSEAIKNKQKERSTEFNRSYVFQNRARTPPRFLKQEEYATDLGSQVEAKAVDKIKRRQDTDFLERLEQVQLAEELSAQRERYLRDKHQQTDMYRKALSAQVRFKPLPLPGAVADSKEPIFGKFDATNEQLAERRRRAIEVFQDQISTVENRRKNNLTNHVKTQNDETDMLEKTRRELIADRAARFEQAFQTRKSLEETWKEADALKKSREEEQVLKLQSSGILLHEQCDQYHRCEQCLRVLKNCGESNIWSESRYIPGSRLIM